MLALNYTRRNQVTKKNVLAYKPKYLVVGKSCWPSIFYLPKWNNAFIVAVWAFVALDSLHFHNGQTDDKIFFASSPSWPLYKHCSALYHWNTLVRIHCEPSYTEVSYHFSSSSCSKFSWGNAGCLRFDNISGRMLTLSLNYMKSVWFIFYSYHNTKTVWPNQQHDFSETKLEHLEVGTKMFMYANVIFIKKT